MEKLVYSNFDDVVKKMKERGEDEKNILHYEECLRLPPETKTFRCPVCGNDTFEGKIANRVYLGKVGESIDIIEDPYEDGELDEEVFCSSCGVCLDRFDLPDAGGEESVYEFPVDKEFVGDTE